MGLLSPKCDILGNSSFLAPIRTQLRYVMGGTLHLSKHLKIWRTQYHPSLPESTTFGETTPKCRTSYCGETSPLPYHNPQ